MCSDENGAPHAVRYLNAQLAVLHENAKQCLQQHPHALSEENKHFYALAGFTIQKPGVSSQIPSESNSLFHARFKAPTLKFICDHDVLLRLTLEKGHFVADGSRGTRGQPITFPADLTVTYRVNFEARKIISNELKIGGYSSAIELVVLDLRSAMVSSVKPSLPTGQDALLRYLAQYLEILNEAGNHILFSLPQFDQRTAPMEIDYSLMTNTREDYEWQDVVAGVTVEQINAYLASLWVKSALLAHTNVANKSTDWRLRCLTEFVHREQGSYYRLKFGAPRVTILCSKEVVIYFDINELEFFGDADFSVEPVRKFAKWKVALIMNVMPARDPDGHSVTITLDFTNARYHHGLSSFTDVKEDDALANQYCDLIVSFFTEEYLHILHGARYHIIYFHSTRVEKIVTGPIDVAEEAEGNWGIEVVDGSGVMVSSRETIQRTKMYGFDQVVAISQGSINAQLALISHTLFRSWCYGESFSVTLKPLSLYLLSNNRAIVWVSLTSGKLKTLDDGKPCDNPLHEFKDWRVAFEVELKMCTEAELEGSSSATYKATPAYQKHGHKPDRELKHIYLDFQTAEYIHDYSQYPDLQTFTSLDDGRSTMLKLEAVIWYLTEHYFHALHKEGLNVISTVPVWKPGQSSLPSYALTSVAFHVYSKVEVTRYNWVQVPVGMEPAVVILGTTGSRPLPSDHLAYSANWVVHAHKGFSHGTISIAHRVFIQERLLKLLANINALTTLIPVMLDPLMGFHGVSLKKWAEHDQRKDRQSNWRLLPSEGTGYLKYLWEHLEEWRYKLSGNGEIDAVQGISCITRNYVELPTAVKQGALHIKVSGKVELSLALQTGKAKSYNASSAVEWSTHVAVETVGGGIKVNTIGSHDPIFSKAEFSEGSAGKLRNPVDMLHEAFPDKIDFHELVQEFHAFEGAWEFCYPLAAPYSLASPTFNDDGDLLFELRRHGATAARNVALSPTARMGMGRPSSPFGRRPLSRAGVRGGRSSPAPHSPAHSPIGECIAFVRAS
ncbi:hypothetical protein BD414DRAFT_416881 [Trametes punicea]|nr:hypothetical protein BD414DRAFT_416881 [Trametes punicea]